MRHDRKSSFMSKSAPVAAPLADPLFARLGPLAALADLGTASYPRAVRRRLTIVNAMAFLIAIFSAVYALVFAYFDATTYMPLIVINVLLMAIAIGHNSGIQINYIIAAAVAFAIY